MPHAKNVRILASPIPAKTVDSVANKDTRITAPVRTTKMADIVNWRGVTCVRRTRVKTVVLVKRVRMGPVSFVYVVLDIEATSARFWPILAALILAYMVACASTYSPATSAAVLKDVTAGIAKNPLTASRNCPT